MGNYKYLIKNIGLLTLASFATKILSFFLVPLYTNVLSTEQYGTYDLFNTTVSVLVPLLTLNIQDAVIRFALEHDFNKEAVVTVSLRYLIISNCIVAVALLINNILSISNIAKEYSVFFFLMFLTQSISGVVTSYIRGTDHIADLSISSVISSAVTIGLNIIFLVTLRLGLAGYFLANIIGPLVQSFYLAFRGGIFTKAHLTFPYKKEKHEMLNYCVPLIANALAWWVNNASDRYVVIFFCGLAANGIYSVAGKIPQILNVFQTIFSQAWTLSAVKDFDSEDKSGFFANTYKIYNCALTIVCSAIIVFDKILARFLYAKDFYIAWRYVPWLTIAILFGSLSGYVGGLFTAVKDSKIFATSTVVGAVTNIILNLIFTPIFGPLGAAVATTICYVEVFAIRFIESKKYIKLKVNIVRDLFSYSILIIQSIIILFVSNNTVLYLSLLVFFGVILVLYISDIKLVLGKILRI